MHTIMIAASCSMMVLLAICWAPIAAAVLGPDGQNPEPVPRAGWVPPVLAKLNPSICNYKTGQITAADLARVKHQAAAAGLQFDEALPVNCWYKFKQAGSAAQTQKALAVLTLPKQGQAGGVTVSTTGEPLPFAMAEYDQLMHIMQPSGGSAAAAVTVSRPQKSAGTTTTSSSSSSSIMKVAKPSQSQGVGAGLQVVRAAGPGATSA